MMADFDYDTEAIVAEYDSMAHYRGPTALPPVPRIIETQFGLRPGPIFHQHPLVFFIPLTSYDVESMSRVGIGIHILVLSVVLSQPLTSLMSDKYMCCQW